MAWPKGKPRPKTAGRKKGTPNKATADIAALSKNYGQEALEVIAELLYSENEETRLKAAKELLDRGYGKARQSLEHSGNIGNEITKIETTIIDADPDKWLSC